LHTINLFSKPVLQSCADIAFKIVGAIGNDFISVFKIVGAEKIVPG
jgi:hypothetical protein